MSRLPTPSGLPKPSRIPEFGSTARTDENKEKFTAPKEVISKPKIAPKIMNLKAPLTGRTALAARTETVPGIKRGPLKSINHPTATQSSSRTALKRTCPIVPDIKAKVAKPNPRPLPSTFKTGRKSIRKSIKPAAPKRPTKPAPYDYKARFGLLQEKHTNTVQILTDTKEKLVFEAEKAEKLENEVKKLETNLNATESELIDLKRKATEQELKLSVLEPKLQLTEQQLEETSENLAVEKSKSEMLSQRTFDLQKTNTKLHNEVQFLSKESILNKQLIEDYKQTTQTFDIERRKLHNIIQDLKGNIRVFCRIRPPLFSETNRLQYVVNYLDECSVEIRTSKESIEATGRPRPTNQQFSFDKVFSSESTQEDIFLELSQLVQSVLDGYNVCVFAYGQTGSGKTYTMEGLNTEDSLGMIPRAIDLIFQSQEAVRKIGWTYTISASFLEIYNEKIHDLLDTKNTNLEIRMSDSKGTDVYVTNLTIQKINSAAELKKYMAIAQRNRAVAATENNERSSRSHSVAKILIEGTNVIRNEKIRSSLNLVDLAGSEKVQTKGTDRLNETKNINKSLATLAHVILSLKEKNDHIPFRNCKLTHLLMPSLGGNSKTLMLVNVAPFEDCFNESVNSLRFATNVNQCKVGAIKKNKTKV